MLHKCFGRPLTSKFFNDSLQLASFLVKTQELGYIDVVAFLFGLFSNKLRILTDELDIYHIFYYIAISS